MKKEIQVISPRQFAFILISFLTGSASLFIPESWAGRDAWISTILAATLGLIPLLLILQLNKKFKGLTIIEYSEICLGKVLGKIFSGFFLLNAFIIATLVVEDLVLLFNIAIIPATPEIILRSGLVLLVIYALYSGIEAIARLTELYVFPIIFLLLILPFLTLQDIDFSYLQPILADGVKPIIAGSLVALNFPFTQITFLAIILPAVNDKRDSTPLYLLSYFIGSVLLLTRTILGVTIFSAEVIGKMLLPTYQIFRLVNIGEFLNRVEAFFIFVWILGFFTTLLAIYYALILGFSQLLGLKEKEPLIIPIGFLIIFLSKLMFPSVSYFVYFAITLPIINISLNFFYPILLFFSSLFKKTPS